MLKHFKIYIVIAALALAFRATAQSDYILLSDKQMNIIDRLDVKLKNDPSLQFSTVKPYERKNITLRAELIDSLDKAGALPGVLTDVDRYDLRSLLMNNADWSRTHQDSFWVRKPLFKYFFKNKAHVLESHGEDFDFVVDPVLNYQLGHANDGTQRLFINTRGVRLRGQIDNTIGFYTFASDNQERDPFYVRSQVWPRDALPGMAYYKDFNKHPDAYDYFDIRGGITFRAGDKAHFQLAYDKFFIGDGYRTLFLSDFSAPMFFLRSTVKIAPKWSYTGALAQTVAPFHSYFYQIHDTTRPLNYMLFHHLSWQANDWLQLGLFENSMLNTRGPQLLWEYNELYEKSLTANVGKTVRSSLGFDFKANAAKNVQLYGQLLFDDFTNGGMFTFGDEAKNKKAFQLGGKYVDAFGIANLNLQAEYNTARPYTYTDKWNVNNYQHYNQPLAHPLGANFREIVGVASYQPLSRLYLTGKLFYSVQGMDTSSTVNYGSNIFRPSQQDGFSHLKTAGGPRSKQLMGSMLASYEVFENLFIDAYYTIRNQQTLDLPKNNVNYFTIGVRWNWNRRDFEF